METMASTSFQHNAVLLILQLAFIFVATWGAYIISNKIKVPDVILFLTLGVLFGPFLLGSIPVFQILPHGLFPLQEGDIPISQELFSLATIASIILLFSSGLQSDIELFKKYLLKGTVVGMSAIVVSFMGGYFISMFFLPHLPYIHPVHLFLATISTATSVGISSTILSKNKMISSPEGVTILSAAVIDDVIGVILLSIVLSFSALLSGNSMSSGELIQTIIGISIKAIFIWLFFMFLGILFSRKIGGILKKLHEPTTIAMIALALSFILGFVFEYFKLSVIVGAYIVGLTLSNTDISYLIQERVYPIFKFFVPIFFFVSGMYININVIFNLDVLIFGICFSLVGIITKFLGAGIPAHFLGFNTLGASRIGAGMLPRGEVSLIIAGLGRASGVLNDTLFGTVLIMIFISSVIAPILLDKILRIPRKGTSEKIQETMIHTHFSFERVKLAKFILSELIQIFQDDGFFINSTRRKKNTIIHIRKNATFITLHYKNSDTLTFTSEKQDIKIIRTAVNECVSSIAETTKFIQTTLHSHLSQMMKDNTTTPQNEKIMPQEDSIQLKQFLSSSRIALNLQSNTKKDIIAELVSYLETDTNYTQHDIQQFLEDVYEREEAISTGLEHGVAIPHARSDAIDTLKIVIGIKKEGIDFKAFDGNPCSIFVLIASPLEGSHLEVLTKITILLNNSDFRQQVLQATSKQQVLNLFSQ